MEATKFLDLNSHILCSFKECPLLFGLAEMDFVIVWFLNHFTLKPTPSFNGVCVTVFINHLHIWVTKFKPSPMFFQLPVLTLNNIVWVNFFAILFNETQHVIKTFTSAYVPVCYEVINLFIEPQNFLLMGLICKLKGLYLIVRACDSLLMFFLYFFYTFFGEPFYKNNCPGFFRANSNFNCTIQINEDIMRIFCPPKVVGHTATLYFRPGVGMVQ